MKKIKLSSFGFNNYYLCDNGKLYKADNPQKEIKPYKCNRFYLIDNKGKTNKITVKKLYRMVFNKEFCIDTIENLKGEEWQPIANTKGRYFISNCGRVKSYCGNTAIILKPYKQKSGYLEIKIDKKNIKIHQLVAQAFCENRYINTDIKTEIHHINRIRTDNRAENLLILSIQEHHKAHKKECINNE